MTVRHETDGPITVVTIDRPQSRNAVDAPTAKALAEAFRRFEADSSRSVAIPTGADGAFCAGYDLKQTATGHRAHRIEVGDGPMGPTRMKLAKPMIAAIEGPAVAGGLELTLWCIEAERIGLVNRLVEPGQALAAAHTLAMQLAALPQAALRSDRLSAIEQWSLDWDSATLNEFRHGIETVETGQTEAGARRFASGAGRHGA